MLIIGFTKPEPEATAAGKRMIQLIKLFIANDFNITFASTAADAELSYNLINLGIDVVNIQLNDSGFDDFLREISPSIVLFDRFLTEEQFGWRVAEICPNALRILDTEDLHFLRNAREKAIEQSLKLNMEILTNDIFKREIASIYRSDISLIISKTELKLLQETFNINPSLLHYIPFLIEETELEDFNSFPSFNERNHFISIGNFKHKPNYDSVIYLKERIWPLIHKQLPKAAMHIYGAYTNQRVKQLESKKEGFIIKGYTTDLKNTFINARVCLAPLRFGAGLKGKLIDAMKYGTPSITTTIGAEGIQKNESWSGFITDNPKEFALKAIELYSSAKKWEKSQKNGEMILNNCFSAKKFGVKLISKMDFVHENLKLHRIQNHIGCILMHHTLQSTKYLSKWIEEKNKNHPQN